MQRCEKEPGLFVSFKDVLENDQSPIPIWYDDIWTANLTKKIHERVWGFWPFTAAL